MNNDRKRSSYFHIRREPSWTGMVRVVRPTLIAAIGGTGTAAAKAARARVEHFIGSQHYFIASRAFDTAPQDNQEPHLIENAEYVYLGGFNAQSVIADIVAERAFRHWAEWLPPRLNFQQVAYGAGGIRPIGRLCYFYHRDKVKQAVRDALTTITDSDLALRYQQQTGTRVNLEAGIDIHLVGSVCGGTGSGIFLDLAFDLRRWAEEHTNREVTVTGHLVLPEAFRRKPVVMTALEANAYIALQELDRFMNSTSTDPWTVEYTEFRQEISERAPFDSCYLLSGLQQGGTSDVDTLAAVIGEAILLLTLSQAGQKISGGVINTAGQSKSTRDHQGRVCCYSSYSVLGLEFPEELLGESLGPSLARELHKSLIQTVANTSSLAEDLQAFQEEMKVGEAGITRVEDKIPSVSLDTWGVQLARKKDQRTAESAKSELQRLMGETREKIRQDLRRETQDEMWSIDDLRHHVSERVRAILAQPGGLSLSLQYLAQCVEAMRHFQRRLRDRIQEAETKVQSSKNAADNIEHSSLSGRDWKQIDQDEERWREHVRESAVRTFLQEQVPKVERLVSILQQEFITPWTRIKGVLDNLRLATFRNEESYYRVHRARTSVCPLSWFESEMLKPNQEILLGDVRKKLIEESRSWAALEPRDLNARFYQLCTEAIYHFFRTQDDMSCDRLLADCFKDPVEYKEIVTGLLMRSQASWELHESYALRGNLLEISCIGVQADSHLYQTVQQGNHQILPVEEQRDDYAPIFRTEHGLSLSGLKSLPAYRRSMLDSVDQEQRFDFHFFSDKRWAIRMEFAGEEPQELQHLYVFSTAEMVKLLHRVSGKGYLLNGEESPLGRYRRAAFRTLCKDPSRLGWLEKEIKKRATSAADWRDQLVKHIKGLQVRVEEASKAQPGTSDHFLSQDIYQLHAEIRALRDALRIEEPGL
jgi:hypothetical protein